MMEVQDTIRAMREFNQLTQEDVAEKLNISVNAYSKIERGLTKLSLEKLEQIANIFHINVSDLYSAKEKGFLYLLSEHHGSNYFNYFNGSEALMYENEKLKSELELKDQLLSQQKDEISALKQLVALLQTNK